MAVTASIKSEAISPQNYWPPPQGAWTYDDYARLPENGMRYEIIEGELYMSPAPSPKHQEIIANLYGYLWDYLKKHAVGKVFFAPIDVILSENLATPVQPDLLFIAKDRLGIVKEKFIEGAPDLIVEVLASGNPAHDRQIKYQVYAQAGVREYWPIDPETQTIEVNVLRGQAYAPAGHFGAEDQVLSEVLPELSASVGEICPA